jgi:O-6-methylguanine DNA methyltransferase
MLIYTMNPIEFNNHITNSTIFYCHLETFAGQITILATEKGIFKATFEEINTDSYLKVETIDKNKLLLVGTNFQINVWKSLLLIPKGKTSSYQEQANIINQPKAVRAVASAIAKNNIAYFIPCHRVIHKNNKIYGYRWGTQKKLLLLKSEKNYEANN